MLKHSTNTLYRALAFGLIMLLPAGAITQDWDDCAWELGRLIRALRDAEWAAEEASSKQQDLETAKSDYENCASFPDVYDLWGDRCATYYSNYQSALDDYQGALSEMLSQMASVEQGIRRISLSCDYQFDLRSGYRLPTQQFVDQESICETLHALRGVYEDSVLIAACRQMFPPDSCKKCAEGWK